MLDWKSPWVLGGAGVLLVLMVFMRGSSSSGSAGSLGVASQNLATSGNVALAGIGVQMAQVQGQVDISAAGEQTSQLGLALGYLSNINNNQLAIKQTKAAVDINSNNNATTYNLGVLSAGVNANNNQTALGITNANNSAAVQLASISTNGQIQTNADNNATYRDIAPQLAQIQGNTQIALAQTSAQTQNALAMIQRSTATDRQAAQGQSDMFGMLGNIFGGVTSVATSPSKGTFLGGLLGL